MTPGNKGNCVSICMYQEERAIAFLQEFLDEYENAYIAHSRLQQPLFIAVAGYLPSETVHMKSSELSRYLESRVCLTLLPSLSAWPEGVIHKARDSESASNSFDSDAD